MNKSAINHIESGPLFVGLVALKSSDSIVAAAADDEEGEDVDPVGDDELAIFSLFPSASLSLLKTVSKHPCTGCV